MTEHNILDQGFLFCTIDREGEILTLKTVFLGRTFEAQARMKVTISGFEIVSADWEVHKGSEGILPGKGSLDELKGEGAFLNIGSKLGNLPRLSGKRKLKSLFFECVKGLIQAETYVIDKRGFPDEKAYEAYWWGKEKGGCRFYSNEKNYSSSWFNYVGQYRRELNLFNRCKSYQLMKDGQNRICRGTFSDSFHEMAIEVCIDCNSNLIKNCDLSVFRAPSSTCFEMEGPGQGFIGKNIYAVQKEQITTLVGGAHGCYHITDLMTDLMEVLCERKE